MDIIPGLISDKDVQYMPDSLLIAFSKVFDDIIAMKFRDYIENPEADKTVVDRLQTLIGDSIKSHTFHEEVISNGTKDIIMNLSVETLPYANLDYDLLINTLKWAKDNRQYMRATIDPRTRENYKTLESETRRYDALVAAHGYPVVYDNLYMRVKDNKKLFYSPNEKQKGTRIGSIIRKAQECDIALIGLQYIKYCSSNGVTGWRVSEF